MSVVGIDIGTTNSAIAIVNEKGVVEVLVNEIGAEKTPSVVSFNENGNITVGQEAKDQISQNPSNTIINIKSLIGYNYNDFEVEKEKENYPYEIVKGNAEKAVAKVDFIGKRREYTPEEISSYILAKLKILANKKLGQSKPIEKAVITVPSYFSSSQRKATKLAGKAAGIDDVTIISDPIAAAIAYNYKNASKKGNKNVFVIDFGGGTLDCTLINVKDNCYRVIATSGNTHLGGEDIDEILSNYAAKKFKKSTRIDVKCDRYKREYARLKLECEKVKCRLSSNGASSERIFIDNFVIGKALNVSITKNKFEDLISDIIDFIMEPLNEVFEEAGKKLRKDIDPTEFVDDVIMIGGSTHIPRVAEMFKEFFKKDPIFDINSDTAVVQGAAIYAASLAGIKTDSSASEDMRKIRLIDVIPLSIGYECIDGSFSEIFINDTPVPSEKTQTFFTVLDYQTSLAINIFEGQRKVAIENRKLGSFRINGLTPRPKGETRVEMTFSVTDENIFNISAKEIGGDARNSLTIESSLDEKMKQRNSHVISSTYAYGLFL